ncbi:TPA: hypothetical protein I6X49_002796 [Vibrio cholerae]|nr:hypothetical protein [Vibrio cholerae]HAS2823244.1 hypothetical protein [Vibrio cholerae]HAS2826291.1 hypothetical protein [Vibrio cholerae]HAS2831304.1 hypothetical protein [Vibrio cholerae]HAS2834920.1 hypothetical protein [Vibrio cholerae]
MKITKGQKEFIGSQFSTPKGGTLTVTSVHPIKQGRAALFTLVCSICSADTELWPRDSIIASKGHLVNGHIPCACTNHVRWTKGQFEILIKRKCEEKGYIFQGFVGEYKGSLTYIKLHNPSNGVTWQTTKVCSFLYLGTSKPKQKQQAA